MASTNEFKISWSIGLLILEKYLEDYSWISLIYDILASSSLSSTLFLRIYSIFSVNYKTTRFSSWTWEYFWKSSAFSLISISVVFSFWIL